VRINRRQDVPEKKEYIDHYTWQKIAIPLWKTWLKFTEPVVDEIKIFHDPTGNVKESFDVMVEGRVKAMTYEEMVKLLTDVEVHFPQKIGINKLGLRVQTYLDSKADTSKEP